MFPDRTGWLRPVKERKSSTAPTHEGYLQDGKERIGIVGWEQPDRSIKLRQQGWRNLRAGERG